MGRYRIVNVKLDRSFELPNAYWACLSFDCKRFLYLEEATAQFVVYDLERGIEVSRSDYMSVFGGFMDVLDFFEIPNTSVVFIIGTYSDSYRIRKYDYVSKTVVDERILSQYKPASIVYDRFFYHHERGVVTINALNKSTSKRCVIFVSVDDISVADEIEVNQSYTPYISVLSKDAKFLLISYTNANVVSVYNTDTKSLVCDIPIISRSYSSIPVMNYDNSRVIVTLSYGSVSAEIYDLRTLIKVGEINLVDDPSVVEYGVFTSNVYTDPIPLFSSQLTGGYYLYVFMIDADTLESKYRVDLGEFAGIYDVLVSQNGKTLVVAFSKTDPTTGEFYTLINIYSVEYEYLAVEVEVVGGGVQCSAEVEVTISRKSKILCSVEVEVVYRRALDIKERVLDSASAVSYETLDKTSELSELWKIIVYDILIRQLVQVLSRTRLIR